MWGALLEKRLLLACGVIARQTMYSNDMHICRYEHFVKNYANASISSQCMVTG